MRSDSRSRSKHDQARHRLLAAKHAGPVRDNVVATQEQYRLREIPTALAFLTSECSSSTTTSASADKPSPAGKGCSGSSTSRAGGGRLCRGPGRLTSHAG